MPAHPGGRWSHREGLIARERIEDYLEQHGVPRLPLRQVVYSPPPGRFLESSDHAQVIARIRARAELLVTRFAWRDRCPEADVTSSRLEDRISRAVTHRRVTFHGLGRQLCTAFGTVVVHLWRGCQGEYDRWGPHAHIVCPGIDSRAWRRYASEERHRRGPNAREILKQVRYEGGLWVNYRGRGLERHLVYELGHAAVIHKRHALVWYGGLKTWAQPPLPADDPEEPPVCTHGDRMERFGWEWELEPVEDGAETVSVRRRDGSSAVYTILGDDPPDSIPDDQLTDRQLALRYRLLSDDELRARNGGKLPSERTPEETLALILDRQDEEDRERDRRERARSPRP
jgi:hypothetical protein